MTNIYRSKDFAEQCARDVRCCGVHSARVREIVAYEVITELKRRWYNEDS